MRGIVGIQHYRGGGHGSPAVLSHPSLMALFLAVESKTIATIPIATPVKRRLTRFLDTNAAAVIHELDHTLTDDYFPKLLGADRFGSWQEAGLPYPYRSGDGHAQQRAREASERAV